MFEWFLKTPLRMTVVRYRKSISKKKEILFNILAKKTQPTLILGNGSTNKMNNGPNEKTSSCLKNRTEKNKILE